MASTKLSLAAAALVLLAVLAIGKQEQVAGQAQQAAQLGGATSAGRLSLRSSEGSTTGAAAAGAPPGAGQALAVPPLLGSSSRGSTGAGAGPEAAELFLGGVIARGIPKLVGTAYVGCLETALSKCFKDPSLLCVEDAMAECSVKL